MKTVFRERSSGRCACDAPAASTAGESRRAHQQTGERPDREEQQPSLRGRRAGHDGSHEGGSSGRQRPEGAGQVRHRVVPAEDVQAGGGRRLPIIACSSEVIGPDSLASVDIVPVRAATIKITNDEVSANTVPEMPSRTSRTA